MMEAADSFETMVPIYQAIQYHIPEDQNFNMNSA